jgi:thioredoxin 1
MPYSSQVAVQCCSQVALQCRRIAAICAVLLLVAGCNNNRQQVEASAAATPSTPAPSSLAPDAAPAPHTLFPDPAVAKSEIHEALQRAKAQNKRVILDFGGNWCIDCKVLDIYFHDPQNKALLEDNFELVDVNIGHYDANTDIAARYGIPLQLGVPALVVLSPDGKVLMAQKHREFEKMRQVQSSDVTKFLNDWKPNHGARGGQ